MENPLIPAGIEPAIFHVLLCTYFDYFYIQQVFILNMDHLNVKQTNKYTKFYLDYVVEMPC